MSFLQYFFYWIQSSILNCFYDFIKQNVCLFTDFTCEFESIYFKLVLAFARVVFKLLSFSYHVYNPSSKYHVLVFIQKIPIWKHFYRTIRILTESICWICVCVCVCVPTCMCVCVNDVTLACGLISEVIGLIKDSSQTFLSQQVLLFA